MATSNQMTQIAQMYNLLEANLRLAATNQYTMTLQELNEVSAIKELVKSKWQVRDLVTKTLARRGHVIETIRQGKPNVKEYIWDLSSPPFMLSLRQTTKAVKKPSQPTVIKPAPEPSQSTNATIKSLAKITQEVEVVMGDITVVIGRNPKTGRIRIIIDEVEEAE